MFSVSELRVLLVGGSGLTGQAVLRILLADQRFREVHAPLRGRPSIEHPRLHLHPWRPEFPRFDHLPEFSCDAVLCCLGTTIKKAGSREAFQDIDRDAILDLANWAKKRGVPRLILISSSGADPGSINFYLRTKGETEAALKEIGIPSVTVLRPGLLLGARKDFRPAERLGQLTLPLLTPLLRGPLHRLRGTPAEALARFMVSKIFDPLPGFQVIENREILLSNVKRN